VQLALARRTIGVKSGKKCKSSRKTPAKSKRCTLFVGAGALTRRAKTGNNAVKFTGRVGSKALPRATYRLTATARDAASNRSRAVTATFRIVAARR